MKVSYKWISELLESKTYTPAKLKDLLTMHSYEVESVEKVKGDYILNIDVLPNRAADSLSHLGVAREISVLTGNQLKKVNLSLKKPKSKISDFCSIEVRQIPEIRAYTASLVLNIQNSESPKWLKDRLESIGQKSINKIVDISNYVMFLLGQPVHIFDLDKIDGNKILVGKLGKNKNMVAFDDEVYDLKKDDLVVLDANNDVLALAGIKGAKKATVDLDTKNILIESANFDPIAIRKTSKRLSLKTESSTRFENGIHPSLAKDGLALTLNLIKELCQKPSKAVFTFEDDSYFKKKVFDLSLDEVSSLLGVDVSKKDVLNILKRLDFDLKQKGNFLLVSPPLYRVDINYKEDVIEEIGRVIGYENIKSKPILTELLPIQKNEKAFYMEKARDVLSHAGFYEVYNYSFVSKDLNFDHYSFVDELQNPISIDKGYLRPTLLISLLNNLLKNIKHKKEVMFFEIGDVFEKKKNKIQDRTACALAYARRRQQADDNSKRELFYEIKGYLEHLFLSMGVSSFWFKEEVVEHKFWHSVLSASLMVDDVKLGEFGLLKDSFVGKSKKNFDFALAEINFDLFLEFVSEEFEYKPLSKYPASVFDLSILVDRDVYTSEVEVIIQNIGGEILQDTELFDVYDNPESDKKSVAFHLVFQSPERTLTDKEVYARIRKIIDALKEKGFEVKGEEYFQSV